MEANLACAAPCRARLLRDTLAARFETAAERLLFDPWAARNDYIHVVLDRSPESVNAFLAEHATRELNAEERIEALHLLEIQRQAMLMYTSCGWFFAELSGIETVQVLHYAARNSACTCARRRRSGTRVPAAACGSAQ